VILGNPFRKIWFTQFDAVSFPLSSSKNRSSLTRFYQKLFN
jgi:hypothetical protein